MHPRPKNFTIVPYQSTHNTGGTMMGSDPKSSVVNRYLQAWDAHNLFVQGASVFPQQHGYNPTGTVGALCYWSAQAIIKHVPEKPGSIGSGVSRALATKIRGRAWLMTAFHDGRSSSAPALLDPLPLQELRLRR